MLKTEILESSRSFSAVTYLISSAGEYAVIDPTTPYNSDFCDPQQVKYILLTHCHFDHIYDVQSWVDATGAKVIISEIEVDALKDPYRNCYIFYNNTEDGYFGAAEGITDGAAFPFGDTVITFMSTPGHTAGSGVYLCDGYAFVGDTIFAGGGYGRFDLPTGNLTMLRNSIQKLIKIDEKTVVYPGHGPSTTIRQYKLDIGI